MEKQGFKNRLQQIINERFNGNVAKFCRETRFKPPTIHTYLSKRGSIPRGDTLEKLAKAIGVSGRWLLTGEETTPELPDKEKYYELIPHVKGELSSGHGTPPPTSEVQDWLWIPKKYLPGGGDGTRYEAVSVIGESMYPLLQAGDVVIVDHTDYDLHAIKEDSLYAVFKKDEEATFVKRLSYNKAEHMLTLISFNQEARPRIEHIKIRKEAENPIKGKVVFSFRRWK